MTDKFTVLPGGKEDLVDLSQLPLGGLTITGGVRPDIYTPSHREKLLGRFLDEQGISYDYATESYISGEDVFSYPILLEMILERANLGQWGAGINEKNIARILTLWTNSREREVVAAVRERLPKYDKAKADSAIQDWLQIACREGDKGKQYSHVMIAQFVWQVRRALANKKRWDHVMLVWQGEQEIGKSTSARGFLNPLAPLWDKFSLEQIIDERHFQGLKRSYAGYIGELNKGRHAELEALKNILTEDNITMRWLGTHKRSKISMNCSFIGDTNRSVATVFKDDENRRFWEIRLKPKGQIDVAAVRDFPRFIDFWAAADENDDISPLERSGYRKAIRTAQTEELATQREVIQWINSYDPPLTGGSHRVSLQELYDAFVKWATPLRLYTGSSTWFSRELTGLFERGKSGSKRYYLVNRVPKKL